MMSVSRAFWERMQAFRILFLFGFIFAAGFALGHLDSVSRAQSSFRLSPETERAFDALFQTYNLIREEYIDKVETAVLVDGAIAGMVDALGDRYSGYMDPDLYAALNDDLDGTVEGIGAEVRTIQETGEIEIMTVMPGTPAMRAGLMPGDIFVKVNGEDVLGASQFELVRRVRGPAGTEVTLEVRRGSELLEFVIVRAVIEIPNMRFEVLDDNVAYIKLYEFNAEARNQLDNALSAMDINTRAGLILDLRGNPGGLLSTSIDVASAFIEDGVILIQKFGDGREQIFNANGKYSGLRVPLVVLVDETSASASELVAGAFQDRGVAMIIGEKTLGKGTVQTWSALVNGGGVRLTIARWLTPNGTWIHEQGVIPDIVVEWSPTGVDDVEDPQLAEAVTYIKSLVSQ